MAFSQSAGSKISIGTTATTTTTDTYTQIGEVSTIPAFGRTYNEVTFTSLSDRNVRKVKGSRNDGNLTVQYAYDPADTGQDALRTALDVDADYNFKIELADAVPAVTATVTITIASPGVVTWTSHGLPVGAPVVFTTTGSLPTGLTAGTTYYVKTVVDANSFQVSATSGGTVVNTSGTQSGTHTGTSVPTNTIYYLKAKVMSAPVNIGSLDGVLMAETALGIKSGSITTVERNPVS